MRKSFVLLTITMILVFAIALSADIKIVQKTHTSEMMGQPAKDQIITIYMSSGWVRQETGEMTFLFNADTGDMYFINDAKKEYSIIDFEKMKGMMQMAAGMMGEMKVDIVKTGKTMTVKKWKTVGWKMTLSSQMFNMDMDMYATKALSIPDTYKKFQDKYADLQGPMGDMMKKMNSIDGYPVKSIGKITVMGMSADITSEVVEFTKTKLPASLFKIPTNYTKIEFNPMAMQGK